MLAPESGPLLVAGARREQVVLLQHAVVVVEAVVEERLVVLEILAEFGGVLYTDRPFVVAEVKPVTAGQPADPVCNVFTTWGSFAQPPLVASPNARLPMAARRAVELQALAEIQARMAKYDLTPNGIERLVRDLREKKEALSTIIFNCDDALIDAHEERASAHLTVGDTLHSAKPQP